MMLIQNNTLAQVLQKRSALANVGVTFIEGSNKEEFLSYKKLYELALRGLGYLQSLGIRPKSEVVFQVEDNKSFVIAFWACLLGGMIPVPVTVGSNEEHRRKLFNIWQLLNNPYLIGSEEGLSKIKDFAMGHGFDKTFNDINANSIQMNGLLDYNQNGELFDAKKEDIAFIQFSSGSTGTPKGVILTHENLVTNINAIGTAAKYSKEDAMISWMPLTHDMGLIGFHLSPLLEGLSHFIMPASLFVRSPSLWLEKASEHKASVLCSPNFGYKYVLKHTDARNTTDIDLSGVRLVYNGAEPISVELCKEFLSFFSKSGLKSNVMCPVYGLAEASVAVSMSNLEDEIISLNLDREKLQIGDRISELADSVNTVSFVNVGKPVPECLVRIADSSNKEVLDQVIGYVQIKGKNVTAGYYNNETANVIDEEGWLNTGDIGLLSNGSLYITGRAKDIIFVNGQNFYPHDIEQVAQSLDEIELNKIAVVGYFNIESQENETIAFVFHRGDLSKFVSIANALKNIVNSRMGLELNRVLPMKDIPRTTSGKLQRFKLTEQYKAGLFDEIEIKLDQLTLESGLNSKPALASTNEIEEKVVSIWEKVLRKRDFTPSQRFLEVGGTSLKLSEVGMLIWREFEVELSLAVLFKKQTVKALANEIQRLHKTEYQPIPKVDEQASYPVASSQKRLYYAWQIDKESLAYNNPVAFKIKGRVEHETLEDIVGILIQKNDVLRMSFEFTSVPMFRIHENVSLAIDRIKCKRGEEDAKLKSFVKPFDLSEAPVYRVILLEVDKGDSVLFLDFHHILLDGVSVYNFIRDLLNLYSENTTQEGAIDYKDFVSWETQRLLSDKLKSQKAFWHDHLSGKIPILSLPYDFKRPAIFTTTGKKIEFKIGQAMTESLRELAETNSCTLFTLMLAFYKLLLFKYSGQKEVVVGIPVAGRNHPDLLDLYGMFVNNVALKSSISDNDRFIQFLKNHNDNVEVVLKNQDYPFELLVDELENRSDPSRNPIFDTMFIYQNMGIPEFHADKTSFTKHFFDPGFSKFDISMEIFDCENSLQFNIEYATEIFEEETIRRLAHHFNYLIARVLKNPQGKISDLLLISEYEYDKYIYAFNNTEIDHTRCRTMDQLFEDEVRKNPSALAIVDGKSDMTYKELNDKANELAMTLKENGVAANKVVAILMRKSTEFIVSILGVLKAGGCYLPLDIDSPDDRIKHILKDSRSEVLITRTDQKSRIEEWHIEKSKKSGLTVLNIDEQDSKGQGLPEGSTNRNSVSQLAYIIYTSGTTGNPKGVMIEHQSLVNYILWASDEYVNSEKVSFPLFTNTAFDLTITSIFTPLATGNSVVIYEDKQEMAITNVIEDNKVNIVKLTPSHLRILKEIKIDKFAKNNNLKKLIVGGEALDADLARDVYNKFNGEVDIYNEYGPTEATIGCMTHKFDPKMTANTVPIGKPIGNTQVYILDEFLKPVPIGVKGELYLSGEGVARGYLFKKQLTAERFISNPFIQGQRMYKTGDLVKRLPDGNLEFIGRSDDQVKIRGYRVELSEIATSLKENVEINDAIVIQKTTNHEQSILIAYYLSDVIDSKNTLQEATIKVFLAKRLPDYMIPRHFIRLENFPLTKNGKVDSSALPEPTFKKQYLAPKNSVETALLEIWNEIFGREDLGVTDNFFELGGDSIIAVQIASRLFAKKIQVKERDILRYHTIEQIALHANVVGTNIYEQGILNGERGLTPIELWFFEQSFKNPNYYNQSVLLNFHKAIQVPLVNQTLKALIEHHDTLRTNYTPESNKCFYNNKLFVEDAGVNVYDLDQTSENLEELCIQIKQSLDIATGSLIKGGIFTGRSTNYLFLTAHHLTIDGVSWRILLEDFYVTYNSLEAGNSPELPSKTASMQQWQKNLVEYKNKEITENNYWDEVSDIDFVIPQDYNAKGHHVSSSRRKVIEFDVEQTTFLLTEAHKAYNTDVLTLLTTSLALTLNQWTGEEEFVIEFENHGRHLEEIDASRTVGWFTSMYPVKLMLKSDALTDQIKGIKEQLREVPDFGIGSGVKKYLQKNYKHDSRLKVPSEIRFNYLGQFGTELNNNLFSYSDRSTGEDVDPENVLTTKLELNLKIIDMVLSLEIKYSSKAFKASTINSFCKIFHEEMTKLLDHIKSEKEVHFSPSDFEEAELDDELLGSLFK